MTEKRYAIVRVDGEFSCPSQYESIKDEYVCKGGCYPKRSCNNGKVLYGDTKEQLIRKVAQIRFKQEIKYGSKDMLKTFYNMCYRQAKEIVEFLGVE